MGKYYGSHCSIDTCSIKLQNLQVSQAVDVSSPESTPQRKPDLRRLICHSNPERSRAAKLRVIRMLCAVVIEYFVCWTPFYAVQTWRSFHEHSLMENFSNLTFSLFFMLAFLSSSCNPVTYCLLNKRFRQSFIVVLRCCTLTPLRRFSQQKSKWPAQLRQNHRIKASIHSSNQCRQSGYGQSNNDCRLWRNAFVIVVCSTNIRLCLLTWYPK